MANTIALARRLRREMSLPEVLLWQHLRRQVADIKFRRQHPCGPYVLDFWCAAARVAVEIDGFAHDMGDRPERDGMRDQWMKERGMTVLRIAAKDVLRDPVRVAEGIAAFCHDCLGRR